MQRISFRTRSLFLVIAFVSVCAAGSRLAFEYEEQRRNSFGPIEQRWKWPYGLKQFQEYCETNSPACDVQRVYQVKGTQRRQWYISQLAVSPEARNRLVDAYNLTEYDPDAAQMACMWDLWPESWKAPSDGQVTVCYGSTWPLEEYRSDPHILMCVTVDETYILWR